VVPSHPPSPAPSISDAPSTNPSQAPSISAKPSSTPTSAPTSSTKPSVGPTPAPSDSAQPTAGPTQVPSVSIQPSGRPSAPPSVSDQPSDRPTSAPFDSFEIPDTSQTESPTACPETRAEVSVCVSLDQSGSLDDVFPTGAQDVGEFGYNFITAVEAEIPNSNFASNTFKARIDEATVALGPPSVAKAIFTPFEDLTSSGNTNIEAAIRNCHDQLDGPDQKSDRVLVLVGDGAPTACSSRLGCDDLGSATQAADAAKAAGILLITVFIGDPSSDGFQNFQDFASEGGYAFRIDMPTVNELTSVISRVVDSTVCGDSFTFPPTTSPVPTAAPTEQPDSSEEDRDGSFNSDIINDNEN